jgi:hypothetical protein
MNLFKKTLVASAMVSSFGVSAEAIVASSPLELSAEGVSLGTVAAPQFLSLDIVVGTTHPSASTITLTFDSNVDLAGVNTDEFAGLDSGVTETVTNDPSLGIGTFGSLRFSYGTGSFTFDNVTFTNGDQTLGESDTISFVVNLGNPLTANSAFRIESLTTPEVLYTGIASVDYSAVTGGGDSIETGTSALTTTVSQFSFGSGQDFDAVINRDNTTQFTDGGATDLANFVATNDESLAAALTDATFELFLGGTFTGRSGTEFVFDVGGTPAASSSVVTPSTEDGVTQSFAAAEIDITGASSTITSTFTGTTNIVASGNIAATWSLTSTSALDVNGSSITLPSSFAIAGFSTPISAGRWLVDATVVNVPYFPVGYTGTESTVQFANESVNSADVIVSAIDDDGIEYGPVDLGIDLAGDTVTTLSESALISLFGLLDSTKLSVTFNIDAEDGDVNAYAFSVNEGKRAQLMTSQQNTDD